MHARNLHLLRFVTSLGRSRHNRLGHATWLLHRHRVAVIIINRLLG